MTANSLGGIIFRSDGSFELGLGHLSRCCMLAEHLTRQVSLFAIQPNPLAESYLRKKGMDFRLLPAGISGEEEAGLLTDLARECGARLVVLDRKDTSLDLVGTLKKADLIVADFEDRGAGRAMADILIDQHIWPEDRQPESGEPAFCGFGPEWAILHPFYARFHELAGKSGNGAGKREAISEIIVACGGTDPSGITSRILKTLDRHREPFRITVVDGAGRRSQSLSCQHHPLRVMRSIPSLARLLYRSDLAFVSGGITMSECLCLGVPTVVLPQHEEQFINAARFASQGALLVTPPPNDLDFRIAIEVVVEGVFGEKGLRESIARTGWSLVDGRGIQRLKKVLSSFMSEVFCGL